MDKKNMHEQLSKSPYEVADLIYHYCQLQLEASKRLADYGAGELYTPVEVHTVTRIEENPGITVTEIAEQTARTKGAVSQIVAKLEAKNLIRREKDPQNARKACLYVTETGAYLSRCHKAFDERNMGAALERSINQFGLESVENFIRIIESWADRSQRKQNQQKN